jgi:hypothetical protein
MKGAAMNRSGAAATHCWTLLDDGGIDATEEGLHDVVAIHRLQRLPECVGVTGRRPTCALTRLRAAQPRYPRRNLIRWKVRVQVHVDDRQSLLGQNRCRSLISADYGNGCVSEDESSHGSLL